MKLLKLFLITMALVGIVALCGCTSSNENATAKTTINGEEVIKTQEVKKSAFSNTVKVRVGRQEFEISKEEYDALVNNKVPDWVVDRIQRDTGLPRDKIIEGISKKGAVYMLIPMDLDYDGVKGITYDSDFKEFRDIGIAIGSATIPLSKEAFFKFCYLNGANDIYLNESKYAKQYEQFLKVGAEAEKWFNATVKGKLLAVVPLVGSYSKDVSESIDVYLLKNGWAFIPKGEVDYDGITPINPYKDEKDKRPFDYMYYQKRVEAEKYAQEHKLGIWAIEFPKNEN